MKTFLVRCLLGLVTLQLWTASATEDRTITKVVKLLQSMMEKSKLEGDNERVLYAKYKCYCDTNEAEKKFIIEDLGKKIALLESQIEEIQAATGKLSEEVAKLTEDMAANKAAQAAATKIREDENAAFLKLEKDLVDSIALMEDAIKVLTEVGADQTLGAAQDHKQFMANYDKTTLLKLKNSVRQALVAASSFVSKAQVSKMESFIQQAPFTGTYASQSGEVVGILKQMKDTFTANLQSARATEKAAQEAYDKLMADLKAAYDEMSKSYDSKQEQLGSNDDDLASKKEQLATAKTEKADAEKFLAELLVMCESKAKDYNKRVLLRTNEQAAIAEAISILNSDQAFATFGEVSATKSGATSFLQKALVKAHPAGADSQDRRNAARDVLRKVAKSHKSLLLTKIAALLEADNPFTIVLAEIKKMLKLIDEEQAADDKQHDWCVSERIENNKLLEEKKALIVTLTGEIDKLVDTIENPETGLKAQIKEAEETLETNIKSQKTMTAARVESNLAYQKDIENLVEAETLLKKAIVVLKVYYSKIVTSSAAMIQASPAPPDTWDADYKGQSTGGTNAISMLEFILENTKTEETQAHDAEKSAQHTYEDEMQSLKDEQASTEENLANLQKTLAEKEEELIGKKEDLEATKKAKAAIEAYLLKIKPGCDFITMNIETRTANRVEEKAALNKATELIKGTPAYKVAIAEAHNETLGDCLSICAGREEHVECKACLASVTVPGYCAGHAGTEGC